MTELPIWGWVLAILGIIAAGIGLGFLIIYLFWKIEKRFFPAPVKSKVIMVEPKIEKPTEPLEPEEEPVAEEEIIEEPKVEEPIEQPAIEEEIEPMIEEPIYGDKHRLIKFATTLRPRFNHPFDKTDTIVCWDTDLETGDEVRDSDSKVMKFRVIEPRIETENRRTYLVDESGQKFISVINGKEYLKREANLDADKMKLK